MDRTVHVRLRTSRNTPSAHPRLGFIRRYPARTPSGERATSLRATPFRYLLIWVLLVLLTTGCTLLTPLLRRSPSDPNHIDTPTPQLLGQSRAFPYVHGDTAVSPDWTVEVLDMLRGDRAWERLHAENMFNEPPPEDQEYVLLKLAVTSTARGQDEPRLRLFVTGDQGVVYDGFPATPPQPRLEYGFERKESKEGWRAFSVHAGEQNLLLGFHSASSIDDPLTYLALEEQAQIFVDMSLEDIEPTDVGALPESPAAVGQTVTTADWQVTIERVLWDEAAWDALLEANSFNDPPPDNRRYLLALIRLRYIGLAEGPILISSYDFAMTGGDDKTYDPPAVVEPEPELSGHLFPGGTFTGWLALETDRFTENPLLFFEPDYRVESEMRYFDLNAP